MSTVSAFADGYQSALTDLTAALDAGGEEGARAWIADNLRTPEPEPRDRECVEAGEHVRSSRHPRAECAVESP